MLLRTSKKVNYYQASTDKVCRTSYISPAMMELEKGEKRALKEPGTPR